MKKLSDRFEEWIDSAFTQGMTHEVSLAFYEILEELRKAEADEWLPIESAPKDGTSVFVLTLGDEIPDGEGGVYKRLPRAFIACWSEDGTSWTDENGELPNSPHFSGTVAKLTATGTRDCDGGWLQPDEVTRWRPHPAPPKEG
ncbi:MAG: hypothetical protein KGL39_05205 [Patescibacteria group bacterium]|nr:hypothetical protein [Patescibacteria group bacterium]